MLASLPSIWPRRQRYDKRPELLTQFYHAAALIFYHVPAVFCVSRTLCISGKRKSATAHDHHDILHLFLLENNTITLSLLSPPSLSLYNNFVCLGASPQDTTPPSPPSLSTCKEKTGSLHSLLSYHLLPLSPPSLTQKQTSSNRAK